MANASQWSRFQTQFNDLKKKHSFKILHAKKFKRRAGDFKGRTVWDQLALLQDLAKLGDSFRESVTFTLDNAEYDSLYRGGEKPRKLRIDSRYGLCFRNCLLHCILHTVDTRAGLTTPPKIHVVLESGHPNWSEVRDIFGQVKKEIVSLGDYDLLGDITFADKDSCDPLMMADFFAHYAWLTATGEIPRSPQANEQPYLDGRPNPPPQDGDSGVTHIRFQPGGMADLKNVLIERLNARRTSPKPVSSEGQSS